MKKNTNMIYGIIVIVVFIFGLVMLASPGNKEMALVSGSLAGEPPVSFGENDFDFGAVSMSAGKVSYSFLLKNDKGEQLVVGKMYTSCMCTEAKISIRNKTYGPFGMAGHGFLPSLNVALMPGESADINVVFDPAAHGPAGIGRIERLVYVENNLGTPFTFKIAATVTP